MFLSLVAGLGNPGREYESTRHNLGWVVLDALARKHRLSWKHAAQFQAEVARWLIYEQSDVMLNIGGLRFRLVTGRWRPDDEPAAARRAGAHETLEILDAQLANRPFLAAGRYTIADVAVYAYAHVAGEAGIDSAGYRHFEEWLERVREQPRFMDDLEPYPPNAAVLAGRSIYG